MTFLPGAKTDALYKASLLVQPGHPSSQFGPVTVSIPRQPDEIFISTYTSRYRNCVARPTKGGANVSGNVACFGSLRQSQCRGQDLPSRRRTNVDFEALRYANTLL